MCARWDPRDDKFLSCSLDCTARVWDFSKLKESVGFGSISNKQDKGLSGLLNGSMEVVCETVLEGHDHGVNWCCYNPSEDGLVATGSDDSNI